MGRNLQLPLPRQASTVSRRASLAKRSRPWFALETAAGCKSQRDSQQESDTKSPISNEKATIPSILVVGAVHSHLVKQGLRGYCSLNVECSDALDTHSFAVLIGVGATTINPYLAIDSIYQRFEKKLFGKSDFESCVVKFKKSIDAGLLKIMSKMGISVISSYRGGCNFEAVGLSRAIVSDYFPGMSSRISGIGVIGIEKKIKEGGRVSSPLPATAGPSGSSSFVLLPWIFCRFGRFHRAAIYGRGSRSDASASGSEDERPRVGYLQPRKCPES